MTLRIKQKIGRDRKIQFMKIKLTSVFLDKRVGFVLGGCAELEEGFSAFWSQREEPVSFWSDE